MPLFFFDSSPNAVDGRGWTPLHVAATTRRAWIVECLVEDGRSVDLDASDNHGSTPLHLAAFLGVLANVEHLLRAGAMADLGA